MRIVNIEIFDEIISGTGTTWYSPAELNHKLGAADVFAVQATTTMVLGGFPTVTVQGQHSADDQNWIATPSPEINWFMSEGSTIIGGQTASSVLLLANLRFAISLGGTSPQCRLKLWFTGRAWAGREEAPRANSAAGGAASRPKATQPGPSRGLAPVYATRQSPRGGM